MTRFLDERVAERIARFRKAVERYDWNFQPSKAELIELLDLAAEALRLREALRRGIQAVEHNEKGDVRIDGRWTERAHVVSELRAALRPRGENEET